MLWLFILELILASALCSIYCIMEQFACASDYSSGACGETLLAKYKPQCGPVVSQEGSALLTGFGAAQPKLGVTY